MYYLVSYTYSIAGVEWRYATIALDKNPIEWLAEVKEHPETYVILNVLLMSKEQYERYNGRFKGM